LDYWNQLDPLGVGFANVGDINDDGVEDIVLGNGFRHAGDKFASGSAYIIYGSNRFRSLRQKVDLNNDNVIDGMDLFLFSQQWQKTLR
jgi:hypothetical protein